MYIGNTNLNKELFPEYQFIEEVYRNIVAKTKSLEQVTKASSLKNGLDTDNWFPINPLDYSINPYIKYNNFTTAPVLNNELVSQFMTRVAILENYSCWDINTGGDYTTYGKLDGINAKNTIFNVKVKSIIAESIKDIKSNLSSLNNYEYNNFFITNEIKSPVSNVYKIPSDKKIEVGQIDIQGGRNEDTDYIVFDFQSVNEYKKIITTKKSESKGNWETL